MPLKETQDKPHIVKGPFKRLVRSSLWHKGESVLARTLLQQAGANECIQGLEWAVPQRRKLKGPQQSTATGEDPKVVKHLNEKSAR